MKSRQHKPYSHRQRGAALLAMMLVLITAASYMLVSKLNANVNQYSRQAETLDVLRDAKAALLSYSVTYPDDPSHTTGGPGVLPCPDLNNDGSAVANCSESGNTTMGRFPWKTVGVGEFRDHHGETLWYVVSDNFRTPVSGPINSDTSGTLSVNTNSDVVAVIFSPGEPLASQNRFNDPTDPVNYLEGGNEVNDNNFVQRAISRVAGNEFNDQLVFITRRELMDVVEKRVIGEVSSTLLDYQLTHDALPWLAPFGNPASSSFRGITSTWQGHLPFHLSTDGDPRNPFVTDMQISWSSISNAIVNQAPHNMGVTLPAPTTSCTRNSECNNGADPFDGVIPSSLDISNATCIWSDRDTFDCSGSYTEAIGSHVITQWGNMYGYKNSWGSGWVQIYARTPPCSSSCSTGSGNWSWTWAYFSGGDYWESGWDTYSVEKYMAGSLERRYDYDITFTDADDASIADPTASSVRTRNLDISGSLNTASVDISVTDTWSITSQWPNYGLSTKQSMTTLIADSDTSGTIVASNIQYDIDIDGGELPVWFVDNNWHEMVYVAYSDSESLPGSDSSICDPDPVAGDCLTVNGIPGSHDNKRAVVIVAGNDMTGNRPSAMMADYFENNNAVNDDTFLKAMETSSFNDKLRIVMESP